MPKVSISARISSLANALLEAESAHTKESEGEIIERCLLATIRTPEALEAMKIQAEKDPSVKSMFEALAAAHTTSTMVFAEIPWNSQFVNETPYLPALSQ